MTPSSVDLSPALEVLGLGVAIVSLPLLFLLRKKHKVHEKSPTLIQSLATTSPWFLSGLMGLAVFLTFDLIIFGAFTRLSDSGLGCPDWPGCYATASPLGAHTAISAAQALSPDGFVTHFKAWIEMIHRYLAAGVGFVILLIAIAAAYTKQNWRLPLLSLLLVCCVGAFGALTVTWKLFPLIVTMHLLLALLLLAVLTWQWRIQTDKNKLRLNSTTRFFTIAMLVLVFIQITLGGWVSTNYAVLVCSSYPKCQGSWWPTMDWMGAFSVWHGRGFVSDGSYITLPALTAIHYAHRLMAYVVFFFGLGLGWLLWVNGDNTQTVCKILPHTKKLLFTKTQQFACVIWCLMVWQLCSGLSNVVLGWPLWGALAHTAGAAWLVVSLVWLLCKL